MQTATTTADPAAAAPGGLLTQQIRTLEQLREHLQVAMQIELATIPPYLTALFSIKDGTNAEAVELLRSIVMEEMLHLTLAANLLNAVGGKPRLTGKDIVPSFSPPGIRLPHSALAFYINIQRFGRPCIDTFMKIENPATSDRAEGDEYHSIGQFYAAIREGFDTVVQLLGEANVFIGDKARQVAGPLYYGGGGDALAVTCLAEAKGAINEIVTEGEGAGNHTIWDGDETLGQTPEPSHYCRLVEIYVGQRFNPGDTLDTGPTGRPLALDWKSVWPMKEDPARADWPMGSPIREHLDAFAATYSEFLRLLEAAFTGSPGRLAGLVPLMYGLKYAAQELMRTPSGDGQTTVGPAWEYVDQTG
jgi:hypothetical protein